MVKKVPLNLSPETQEEVPVLERNGPKLPLHGLSPSVQGRTGLTLKLMSSYFRAPHLHSFPKALKILFILWLIFIK